MAIAQTTITNNPGYARSDVITQLEQAFTWLEWHGDTVSGIVTGLVTYNGGGDINASAAYNEVFQISTSGIGTGASFYIRRDSGGQIVEVAVNRPGSGYVQDEILVISAADIGGSSNGAADLDLTVAVAGNGSPVGYGGTTEFFDKDFDETYPWGVVRHTIQSNKKYGDTYHIFQSRNSTTSLNITSANGFHPWDDTRPQNLGNYYSNRVAGSPNLDVPYANLPNSSIYNLANSSQSSLFSGEEITNTIASSNTYQLDLNVYRSGLDPKFAIFSYKQPTLSSTHLTNNTFLTWFHHNYEATLWDYDSVYLGAITEIIPTSGNTTNPSLIFRTHTSLPVFDNGTSYDSRREAWSGFLEPRHNPRYIDVEYESRAYPQYIPSHNHRIYYRESGLESYSLPLDANFNAAIKGIPACANVMPVPYYIPDDFVLIDFYYNTPFSNIQQGDTITISGSEVYTVISGSYNQTSVTRGILFCARTV
jgi:hypothetical protein